MIKSNKNATINDTNDTKERRWLKPRRAMLRSTATMTLIQLSPVYMTCGKSNINSMPKAQWSRLQAAGDIAQ